MDDQAVHRSTNDLLHLSRVINQKLTMFNPPQSLKFKMVPDHNVPYVSQFSIQAPNAGSCALDPWHHRDSTQMAGLEAWLIEVLTGLKSIQCYESQVLHDQRTQTISKVVAMLHRLDDIKKMEWERQRMSVPNEGSPTTISDNDSQAPSIDTREYCFSSFLLLFGFIDSTL